MKAAFLQAKFIFDCGCGAEASVSCDRDLGVTTFMHIEQVSTLHLEKVLARKRCRRKSLYFSSARELQRSRMTRGKKQMSRTSQSSQEDLRRELRFSRGGIVEADNVTEHNLDARADVGGQYRRRPPSTA